MRIAVDATSWFNGRGYGRFTRELLPALVRVGEEHDWLLLVEAENADQLPLTGDRVQVVPVDCGRTQTDSAASDGYRAPRDLVRFTSAVRSLRPDVFFGPTVYTYFPLPPGTVAVIALHDAIAERFPELTLPSKRARLFWKAKVWMALKQSRLVLTVSDFAARDIARVMGVAPERLRVSGEAPAASFAKVADTARVQQAARDVGVPEGARWFTYVGGFNPHKRVDVLLDAHARLCDELDDPPHVLLVGSIDGDNFHGCRADLVRRIEALGTGDRVHWTGFVPDEALCALLTGALASVVPSECEGFGLPAVEAAICGAPTVATTESPLPQVLEGGGIFVPPGDVDALTAALRAMSGDEEARTQMARVAHQRATDLSWDRAARNVLDALEEAAA